MDETNNQPMPAMPPKDGAGAGSLVATIIILAVIIFGAIYFWRARGNEAEMNDGVLESIGTQNSSDDISDIEADLNTTDVENVDYDLDEENFNAS